MIAMEVGFGLFIGVLHFALAYGLHFGGVPGCAVRLALSATVLAYVAAYKLIHVFSIRMVAALRPFESPLDRSLWYLFAWGKYGAVAVLELSMSVARLTLWLDPTPGGAWGWRTWLCQGLLAFNIFECAVLEARVAQHFSKRHKHSVAAMARDPVAAGSVLNAATGVVLTVITLANAAMYPTIATEDSFGFNHLPWYVPAYMLWNIKFATVAQDNGVTWHICYSHFFAFLAWALLGTDYMEYRVAGLHGHFSIGLIAEGANHERAQRLERARAARIRESRKQEGATGEETATTTNSRNGNGSGGGSGGNSKPSIMQRWGYGAVYDHCIGAGWQWTMAIGAAVFTLLTCYAALTSAPATAAVRRWREGLQERVFYS